LGNSSQIPVYGVFSRIFSRMSLHPDKVR
jgi:hypothetical protein